jgi:hypothetical protein
MDLMSTQLVQAFPEADLLEKVTVFSLVKRGCEESGPLPIALEKFRSVIRQISRELSRGFGQKYYLGYDIFHSGEMHFRGYINDKPQFSDWLFIQKEEPEYLAHLWLEDLLLLGGDDLTTAKYFSDFANTLEQQLRKPLLTRNLRNFLPKTMPARRDESVDLIWKGIATEVHYGLRSEILVGIAPTPSRARPRRLYRLTGSSPWNPCFDPGRLGGNFIEEIVPLHGFGRLKDGILDEVYW